MRPGSFFNKIILYCIVHVLLLSYCSFCPGCRGIPWGSRTTWPKSYMTIDDGTSTGLYQGWTTQSSSLWAWCPTGRIICRPGSQYDPLIVAVTLRSADAVPWLVQQCRVLTDTCGYYVQRLRPSFSCTGSSYSWHDDDDDEIAYFTVHWKTIKLVLSTAPKTWNEWMNECLYYDIWQTADEITTNANKMFSNINNIDKDSKSEITSTKTVKTENGPISRGSQSEVSMVRDLWRKRFTKR